MNGFSVTYLNSVYISIFKWLFTLSKPNSINAPNNIKLHKVHVQCDQMIRLFFNIWPFEQQCHKFGKVGLAFCQIRNKLQQICQWLVNFFQSGDILPNQVTLYTCIEQDSTIEIVV